MNWDFFKNIKEENRLFYTFLAIHLIVWTAICLIRVVMPTDALEGVYWGSLHDWGTPKHPPLAGWLTYLAFIPFKMDICVYLMSQLFIIGGFIYTYKLAKYFLEENQAMLSVVLLEGCWCYSYITGYYGFNPDVILLFMLPAISYYFYNCMTQSRNSDWIKLGIIMGIAFLNKYQTVLLLIPMFIWALTFKREVFKNKFFYIAVTLAFVIFLPHLLWLVKYDFFPLMYFEGEMSASSWLQHLTAPLTFLVMQIAVISGSLIIFALLKLVHKSPFKLATNLDMPKTWFLLLLCFTPLVIHLIMGLSAGGTMRPRWGFEFWFLIGIVLFYFFPCNIGKKEFKFTLKSAYVLMAIIFVALGTLLAVEKNYRSRYPVATIYNDFKQIWAEKYDTPIKYLGGYIEWTLPLTVYVESHPACILDTHGYKDPWLDEADMIKSGVLIIDRTEEGVIHYTHASCPYLPKDYKIEPVNYKFFVHNAFGMPREYSIYYFIVPPKDE